MSMMLLAAVAAIAQPVLQAPAAATQATATIRVIAAVRLRLDALENTGAPRAHQVMIRTADGSSQPARLIEFQ